MNLPNPSLLLRDCSLQELQEFNNALYAEINSYNFELHDMICRALRFMSRALLWIRKKEEKRIGYHLCMMLSWLCALGNKLCVRLDVEVANHCVTNLPSSATLARLQTLFAGRHFDVTLTSASLCLAEKLGYIASELEYFRETHNPTHRLDAAKRVAQSIEALLVVASLLKIQLGEELEAHFANGCPGCHSVPCTCPFRADKVI